MDLLEAIELFNREHDKNTKLKEANAELREALERLNSGAAIYVGGMIPKSMLPEHRARMRFIELILAGKSVKEAESQTYVEFVEATKKRVEESLKPERIRHND